jgi:hypothetical protein
MPARRKHRERWAAQGSVSSGVELDQHEVPSTRKGPLGIVAAGRFAWLFRRGGALLVSRGGTIEVCDAACLSGKTPSSCGKNPAKGRGRTVTVAVTKCGGVY